MKHSFFLLLTVMLATMRAQQIPDGFAVIDKIVPDLTVELRYASTANFTGSVVRGYNPAKRVLTLGTLYALKKVEYSLRTRGLGLKLFDGYRPQRAVNFFVEWAERATDTTMKAAYYPTIPKDQLFEQGYIAKRSGHSRGSTVDLTVIYIEGVRKGEELDMGTPFDFFGPESATFYDSLSEEQKSNRRLLYEVMSHFGFKNYTQEWWHYTLVNEPFLDTYFDF